MQLKQIVERARAFTHTAALVLFGLALAACATLTTNALAQDRPAAGGKARIYVLRDSALPGAIYNATVLLNDVEAGTVTNGSYVAIDRPPGRYKMKVRMTAIDMWAPEYTFSASAGRTYYFSYNAPDTPMYLGHGVFFTIPGSNRGKPVGERSSSLTFHLGQLDARAGAAELAKFKAR